MNIQEATKLAMQEGIPMKRKSENLPGAIMPTNSSLYQCIILSNLYKERQQALGRWQPSAEDLLATDWELEN